MKSIPEFMKYSKGLQENPKETLIFKMLNKTTKLFMKSFNKVIKLIIKLFLSNTLLSHTIRNVLFLTAILDAYF